MSQQDQNKEKKGPTEIKTILSILAAATVFASTAHAADDFATRTFEQQALYGENIATTIFEEQSLYGENIDIDRIFGSGSRGE